MEPGYRLSCKDAENPGFLLKIALNMLTLRTRNLRHLRVTFEPNVLGVVPLTEEEEEERRGTEDDRKNVTMIELKDFVKVFLVGLQISETGFEKRVERLPTNTGEKGKLIGVWTWTKKVVTKRKNKVQEKN